MFTGKLVRLAPVVREDVKLYTEWFSDPEFLRFIFPNVLRPMSYEDEMDWYENMRKNKEAYTFGIRTLEEDRLIGNCSLFRIDWRNRVAVFGIAVGDKSYWGRGYGTDAARVLMGYAFDELNLNRVELEVYDYNKRAIKSYKKVGFVHEGTRRQALFRDGVYYDIHTMGLLRDDWYATRAAGQA
ncbi:MAG: GNAT family N-acetyltransferase [Anaerolineae bacterium]|nr:GNAT family N-acetyltransferase [Anaerolineae bacterium]